MSDFGEKIKKLRKLKGITQKQLAEQSSLTERGIQKYELGERNPNYDAIIAISKALNITTDYLVGIGIFEHWDDPEIHELLKTTIKERCKFLGVNDPKFLATLDDELFLISLAPAVLKSIKVSDDKVEIYYQFDMNIDN